MTRSVLGLALTTALSFALLAGCASTPEPAAAPKAATAPDSGASFSDTTPLTGSRFVRSGTDRTVRVIGNDTARTEVGSEVRSLGNAVGARGN